MTVLFITVTVLLIGIIYFQYQHNQIRTKHLRDIHKRLQGIVDYSPNDKLLLFTDDKELIAIIVEMNQLLEKHKLALANYTNTKWSMKRMISNISHDLKTPLTVILGYIEMIQMDAEMDPEEREVLLSKIHNKSIEVITLVDKFFDLAKLESGDKDVQVTSMIINEICQKGILEYYDILKQKGIDVQLDIPDQPIFVLGNSDALERILNNLISNAILHGGDGKQIGLTVRNSDDFVYIDIWDKGKGIDERHQDRVFDRLYTLEDSRNKSYQGSGLGLTITKRLVEKLGGSIYIDSKPWEKTVFSFSLKHANREGQMNE